MPLDGFPPYAKNASRASLAAMRREDVNIEL